MEFGGIDVKWWAAGGAVGLLGVWWLRRTLTAPTPTDQTDTTEDGTYPSGEDTPAAGVTPSLYGYYNPMTGQFIGAQGAATQVISTNAQWAQQVLSSMVGSFADTYDAATIGLAISKYLAGLNLTQAEYNIAETAIQLYGKPPTPPPDPHMSSPQPGQPPVIRPPSRIPRPGPLSDRNVLTVQRVADLRTSRLGRIPVATKPNPTGTRRSIV